MTQCRGSCYCDSGRTQFAYSKALSYYELTSTHRQPSIELDEIPFARENYFRRHSISIFRRKQRPRFSPPKGVLLERLETSALHSGKHGTNGTQAGAHLLSSAEPRHVRLRRPVRQVLRQHPESTRQKVARCILDWCFPGHGRHFAFCHKGTQFAFRHSG